jgi:peptide/nickel transport system permease protein
MTWRYLGSRLVAAAGVVIAVAVLIFLVSHVIGDPVTASLPGNPTQAQIEATRQQLGLNHPLSQQFLTFMNGVFHGSFGNSYWQQVPALPLVIRRLPATIYLALAACALIFPIGLTLGLIAAIRPGSIVERLVTILSFAGASLVSFWLALMLIYVFAVRMRWLPISGYGGVNVILPAVTLAILYTGNLAQLTQSSVADQLTRNYVDAARARGFSEVRVLVGHVLRNGLIPVVTVAGAILANLLNGVVIVETVFGWPGVGNLLIQAIQNRDLPLIESCAFATAIIVTVLNLIIDIAYRFINPRVKFG